MNRSLVTPLCSCSSSPERPLLTFDTVGCVSAPPGETPPGETPSGPRGAPHLSHEDLGSLDEHRGAGDVEALLQAVQTQLLHLLIAALHLHRVERQHGDLLHVLDRRRGEGSVILWFIADSKRGIRSVTL